MAPGQGSENYVAIGGDDYAFPDEYSVSGWWKWAGPLNPSDWPNVFRLTMNNKADNQNAQRLGDRVLQCHYQNNFYHFPTYTYTNMVAGGNANSYQNIVHNNQHTEWHFIYFGYSKTQSRAYVNLVLKSGALQLDYPKHNHYWTERFWFVLIDSRYPNYNG